MSVCVCVCVSERVRASGPHNDVCNTHNRTEGKNNNNTFESLAVVLTNDDVNCEYHHPS